ncbi:hypothetical protein ES704_03937 [subsurface metagenome]
MEVKKKRAADWWVTPLIISWTVFFAGIWILAQVLKG